MAAGRIARAGGIVRPGDLHAVDQRDAVHVLQIVVAGERLQRLVGGRGVAAEKRDHHGAGSGLDRDAGPQPRVDGVLGDAQVGVRHLVVFLAAHLRQKHAPAVDADFQLVRILETGQVADDVLQQKNAEVVFAVQRKVVVDENAAARAQRQAFDVLLLVEIRGSLKHQADRSDGRVAHGQARDLVGRRQVLFDQRGGNAQHVGDIVEAVGFIVGGQQRSRVDIQVEKIVDRVSVFGPVHAMDGRPAGFRVTRRGAVDRVFQPPGELGHGGVVRTGHALGRHHASMQLPQNFFPGFRMLARAVQVHRIEREPGGSQLLVVAGDAVFIEHGALGGARTGLLKCEGR